jgi:CheY-like chemotaxis protein
VFSRKQVLAPRVLDLDAIVSDMEKILRRLIGEDVDLVIVRGQGLGRVKADPGQLEQVVMNLAVNARDAMPQGGRLTIETANVDLDETLAYLHGAVRSGRYVVLAVTDTGCGMSANIVSHIFEPFFTTKGPNAGTGLGLSTVYGIVKQSDGEIAVESAPGRGATFRIYLPRVDDTADLAECRPGGTSYPGGSETVLLVEDEDSVRTLTGEILRTCGYTVLEAVNGPQALAAAIAHGGPIHLLVSDVVMPQMGGPELAQRLCAERPHMRVLYLSGYTHEAIVHYGTVASEVELLPKPFTAGVLTRRIRDLLDAYGPEAPVTARP